MATITFTIPDAVLPRIIAAVTTVYKYESTLIDDVTGEPYPNPETKAAFTKRMVIEFLKNIVKQHEVVQAAVIASAAAEDAVNTEVTIT